MNFIKLNVYLFYDVGILLKDLDKNVLEVVFIRIEY